jgi:nitrite reductase/ring-hydroxylating ferredoxin subunit
LADSASEARSEPKASEVVWADIPAALPAPGAMTPFELDGLELVLVNAAGTPRVIEDRCPHAEVALSEGRLEGCVLECPLHGGKLDVRDGRPLAPPIRRAARTFAVRQTGAGLQVSLETGGVPCTTS